MKLLLILGNGFDLNLGLPTSYRHFYQYLGKQQDTNVVTKELCEKLTDQPELWSDLELALGQFTSITSQEGEFVNAYRFIRNTLGTYLREVNELNIDNLQFVARKFSTDFMDFPTYMDPSHHISYQNFVGSTPKVDEINILTFNYTSTVERLIEKANHYGFFTCAISGDNVYHVHGTLDDSILLGVNDISQIANDQFRNSDTIKATMIKPYINREYDDGIIADCCKLIEKSDVILLFGASLGDTDAFWWKELGRRMLSKGKRLIYCPYDVQRVSHKSDILIYNSEQIRRVIASMKLDTREANNELAKKIYIIRKNQLFNFDVDPDLIEHNHFMVSLKLLNRHSIV